MLIVRIQGGLGNQMFQYAIYRTLMENGKDVKMDITGFLNYGLHNGYELPNLFSIKEVIANQKEIELLSDFKRDILHIARRKLLGRKKKHYVQNDFKFINEVFGLDNVYLDGYWQSEKYFIDIQHIIRQEFMFKNMLDITNQEIVERINNTNSVSIHIRRGDYVSNPDAFKVHGGITTLDYYMRAINIIKENIDNPVFFVFSDDMEWAKANLSLDNSYFIDWNTGVNSYKDMQLMSYCKHNIIANSSFSWWGAWLNRNKSKLVVAPNRWFNTIIAEDIIVDNWYTVNVKK